MSSNNPTAGKIYDFRDKLFMAKLFGEIPYSPPPRELLESGNGHDKKIISDTNPLAREAVPLEKKEIWICGYCTFGNKISVKKCEMCENEHQSKKQKDIWECPQCTLHNDKNNKTCKTCDYVSRK